MARKSYVPGTAFILLAIYIYFWIPFWKAKVAVQKEENRLRIKKNEELRRNKHIDLLVKREYEEDEEDKNNNESGVS